MPGSSSLQGIISDVGELLFVVMAAFMAIWLHKKLFFATINVRDGDAGNPAEWLQQAESSKNVCFECRFAFSKPERATRRF